MEHSIRKFDFAIKAVRRVKDILDDENDIPWNIKIHQAALDVKQTCERYDALFFQGFQKKKKRKKIKNLFEKHDQILDRLGGEK